MGVPFYGNKKRSCLAGRTLVNGGVSRERFQTKSFSGYSDPLNVIPNHYAGEMVGASPSLCLGSDLRLGIALLLAP